MANILGKILAQLGRRGRGKAFATPAAVPNRGTSFIDAYQKRREPTPSELLGELKNAAWTCASINAAACANVPPRLYVRTGSGQPAPKCRTKAIPPHSPLLLHNTGQQIEEVVEHPLVNLLDQPNPHLNLFDLWELTQLSLECMGVAYWLLQSNDFTGLPETIWILPAHQVRAVRLPNSTNVIDYYQYTGQNQVQRFSVDDVIAFRIPDPRDPYHGGLSPLRACYESVILTSEYTAMRRSIYENVAIPSVVISPEGNIGEDERDRIEEQWNQKMRRGGAGRAVVTESNMRVSILQHSLGDLAALAEAQATKTDILNAFHIPPPFFSERTNLANMQAAKELHQVLAIGPRLKRRDEKLNQQLVPLFDPSGRLFLASEQPGADARLLAIQQQESDIRAGIRSVNEIRAERGLPPVPWGETPAAARGGKP